MNDSECIVKKSRLGPLGSDELRRSLYTAALLALLLPPFIGGSLMSVVGFYPFPEFYLIFTSYGALYVSVVLTAVMLWIPRLFRNIVELTTMENGEAELLAQHIFKRLFWYFIGAVTVYSIFGVLSADLSMQSMGFARYTLRDHLYNQLGIIPVVLITTFPIFFYTVDRVGRFLAPRGVSVTSIPLSMKMAMLGVVTPLLIETLLIGYYYNRTGYFALETLFLWFSLVILAVGGTFIAWRSLHQSISPLEGFIDTHSKQDELGISELPVALSLDELGVITSRFSSLLAQQNRLSEKLQSSQDLADGVIESAGALVVVLDSEGRIVRFNRASEQLSGYSSEEVSGKYLWETVLSLEDAATIREYAFEALVNNPQAMTGHYTNSWLSRDGECYLIEWNNSLILDQNGGMEYMVSVGIDITQRAANEASMRESQGQLKEAQRIAMVGSWTLDLIKGELQWSDEIFRLFELDKATFAPSYEAFLNAIHPDDREAVNQAYSQSLQDRQPYQITHRLQFPDGRIKYVKEACETLYDELGAPLISRGTMQDITEQTRAEETINLYANVFRHSAEAILITDSENRIVAINPALTELTGYTQQELVGKDPHILASGHTPDETYQKMWQSLHQQGHWQGELADRRKNGEVYPKWATISVVRDEQGNVVNYIASFSDITERKASEERIFQLAHHDTLTGLLNRFSLEERLGQAVVQARRSGEQLAVMFIDMDRFKVINDTLGHHVGDGLLVEVGKRLTSAVRESDIVARLGGDEFIVVLTSMDEHQQVTQLAAKIVHSLSSPYHVLEHELLSSPSVGVAIFPDDGGDADTLMKNADAAMYHAKGRGRNNFQLFTYAMSDEVREGMTLERDLRLALERDEFSLHYQPKIEASDGRISGVEALLRWHHPERGMVSPDTFIPIAEESNLITSLGSWVLEQACLQLEQWRNQGLAVTMAVNLSPKQFSDPKLVGELTTLMDRHTIAHGELELELTETAAMTNAEQAIESMRSIRALGIGLAIDDFGTGYSSLAYLKSFPIQTLKLDRSFVRDIGKDENDTAISKATISLAHSLGLRVVAEGVETEQQRQFLIDHQCDMLQGYLFSRPLPAEEATQLLISGIADEAL